MSSSSSPTAVVTASISGKVGATFATTFAAPAASASKAAAQSILEANAPSPTVYDPSNPIIVFIIQAVIIISLSSFLGFFLKRIRQPRVISEVLGGIILGPTAMGRVKGFTSNIFPPAAMPNLNLVANVGLVLFLFIVGLETDVPIMRKHWRAAAGVGFLGLAIPFGVGAGVAQGLYNKFIDHNVVSFGHFLLFVAVAFAITAFPVLCRILTELKLLQNPVGLTTLAAGVFNDVVGWILLALAVTLVNAGSGVTAVYVLLVLVGWVLFLFIAVKPAFRWLARRSGSFNAEVGPSQGIICLALLLTFTSAWFTQVIGVHAIFGGFLAGLIMPRDARFHTHLTSKIEDLVTVFFLPLYFAFSGLRTNLGLLNDGTIWGWWVAVFVLAEVSKFAPCALAAKFTGKDVSWREAGAIGSLMACKGLVELIVLNIGLSAGILNPPVFAMFVLMALVTTFITTPLALMFYPESYRRQREQALVAAALAAAPAAEKGAEASGDDDDVRSRFVVVLNRLEHLPSMMAFVKLLQPPLQYDSSSSSVASFTKEDEAVMPDLPVLRRAPSTAPGIAIDALRLIELSNRYSDVMAASETDETARLDPLCNIFRTFANLNGVRISTSLAVVPAERFSEEIATVASIKRSDMVIVPWSAHHAAPDSTAASAGRAATTTMGEGSTRGHNPFGRLFGGATGEEAYDAAAESPQTAALVRSIFAESSCDVGLFLERGSSGIPVPTAGSKPWTGREHVFFAFHGGPDDRTALSFVVQLCRHPGVSATVVRVFRTAEPTEEDVARDQAEGKPVDDNLTAVSTATGGDPKTLLSQLTIHGGGGNIDTIYGTTNSGPAAGGVQSETADNLVWAKYFGHDENDADRSSDTVRPPALAAALSRVRSSTVRTSSPLATTLSRAAKAASSTDDPILVVAGRSRRGAPASHAAELFAYLKERVGAGHGLGVATGTEVRKTLGDVGSAVVVSAVAGSVLVVQQGHADRKRRLAQQQQHHQV